MHTPLWIKIGMALGFAYLGIFTINLVGDMLGGSSETHGGEHATTEHVADAGDAGHASETGMMETAPGSADHQPATDHADMMETGETAMADAAETVVAALAGDAASGAKVAKKKCGTCHTFGSGEGHKVGPNLFDIMARGRGAAEGYRYSANLAAMGGSWSDVDLDAFLTDPKAFVAASKMSLKTGKEEERADLVAWLKTLH